MPTEPKQTPRFFALTVPDRSKNTLIPTLKAYIRPESIVWTDGWRAYYTLGNHYAGWDMVNHTQFFRDPNTGVNTNRCEGMWKQLKRTIPDGTRREKIEEFVQLHCFKEWAKCHPGYENLGLFGLLARANNEVILKDKGCQGDAVPNMLMAEEIVAANPLPLPLPAPVATLPRTRGRGRPSKRRRRHVSNEV